MTFDFRPQAISIIKLPLKLNKKGKEEAIQKQLT